MSKQKKTLYTQSLDKVEVVSPCPFLKKVEVASGGGGTTIPVKVVKVASSSHSLKKMEVASPHHPLKKVEVAFPFHFLEKVEVASPLPSLKNVAMHIYIYIYIVYIYIYILYYIILYYILDISPCPFLKKVEVTSGGGGATVSFKAVKVTSSSHSS